MVRLSRSRFAMALTACLPLVACNVGGGSSSATSAIASQSGTATTVASSSAAGAGSVTTTGVTSGYQISGEVLGTTAALTLTGTGTSTATTDSSGNFAFGGLTSGTYAITPAAAGYVFTPAGRAEVVGTASLTGLTFDATVSRTPTFTLSGTVSGAATAGVIITLNGSNVGSTVTNQAGSYSFAGLVSGTYTVSASLDGYAFSSPIVVGLDASATSEDFTSVVAATGTLAFTPATMPDATVGSPYSSTVVKAIGGGTAPYRYATGSLGSGTPPLGMIVNPNGSLTGTPDVAGQYSFDVCASDSAGRAAPCQPVSLTVAAAPSESTPPAPTVALGANPATITVGGSSVLTWSAKNATACTASGAWSGSKAASGSATVAPSATASYVLTCSGAGGVYRAQTSVTVNPATTAAPTVTLTASSATIPAGSTVVLRWSSKNASTCTGSGGWTGTEATSGSRNVSPTSTTTYTLACGSSDGTAQASTRVSVDAAATPPAPEVSLTASETSITAGASSTLTWSATNAQSCTASGGWTGTENVSGSRSVSPSASTTYTLACTGAGGSAQASATIAVGSGNPQTSPPASGTSWVYYNGTFDWPGDYSYDLVPNYGDTSGSPLSGSRDIKVSLTSAWGGWLPYAQNWSFNSAGYTKLTFSLKPTVANQSWSVFFVKVGDVPVGIYLDPTKYGPAPVAGRWATYTIPLADLGVLGTTIYKFCISDQTGLSNNSWYIDNVGFVP